jgi:hypothetical protein
MSHDELDNPARTIPINSLHLDKEIYRTISMMAYSDNETIENVINNLLKKQLATQGFLRNGFELFHKDIVRTLANAISNEKLVEEARNFPTLPKEMVLLNVDGIKPDIKKYIKSFSSFMTVNGYTVSVDENKEEGTVTFYARHNINYKYSLFWGEIIKMTLADIAEITNAEITDTSIFLECKVLVPSE